MLGPMFKSDPNARTQLSSAQIAEMDARRKGRSQGTSSMSAGVRRALAWLMVAIAIAVMAYAVFSWVGPLIAAVFMVGVIVAVIWLYNQFRSYG